MQMHHLRKRSYRRIGLITKPVTRKTSGKPLLVVSQSHIHVSLLNYDRIAGCRAGHTGCEKRAGHRDRRRQIEVSWTTDSQDDSLKRPPAITILKKRIHAQFSHRRPRRILESNFADRAV
jgi:hypothetical protein